MADQRAKLRVSVIAWPGDEKLLTVHFPANCRNERSYIASVIFEELLGIAIELVFEARTDVKISSGGERSLYLDDSFFTLANTHWLEDGSLPTTPIFRTRLAQQFQSGTDEDDELPVLYGRPLRDDEFVETTADSVKCGVDIFGSSFFLLTRYEEILSASRDIHDRFSASSSVAEARRLSSATSRR